MFAFFIKEIRQLRRNTVFWGVLLVQLMIDSLIVGLRCKNFLTANSCTDYYHTIGFLMSFVIAINLAARWGAEKNDDALNPFVTTPLPPARVVAEKYLATFPAVLIPLAMAQIFVAFTVSDANSAYQFACLLPADAAVLAVSMALLLTVSSVSGKNAVLGSVLPGVFILITMLSVRTSMMPRMFFERDHGIAIFYVLYTLLPIILLFALTTAAVSAPGSDRMIPVRAALLVTLAAYLIVIRIHAAIDAADFDPKFVVGFVCAAGAFLSLTAAVAERREQSRRVAAAIRRLPPALRPLRALCSTGAIPELVFSVVLATAATLLIHRADFPWWFFARTYAVLLFCASVPLLISGAVKRLWNKKVHPALLYVIAWLVTVFLNLITVSDAVGEYLREPESAASVTALFGAAALVLLIPTAWDFVASLKRR